MLYINWIRFATDIVLRGRTFVVLSSDETSINTVEDATRGLRGRQAPRQRRPHRPRDPDDRTDVKTTLLATVCDSAALQPFLPQVILPKYTQRARPPQRFLDSYASTGEPLEYWHGTAGMVTTEIVKMWATRVRSLVHSFNPEAWILLIWDCSNAHLNEETMQHLRRLGILVIMVPAKLTWLLQVCDVYVFHELKTRLRMHKSFLRMTSETGCLQVGDWVSACASAVREVVVNRSWEDAFDKMGLGEEVREMRGRATRFINPEHVRPSLPTRAQLGRMVNRSPDTDAFRRLHLSIIGHFLHVLALPDGQLPPRGAQLPLPDIEPARKKPRYDVADQWDETVENHLSHGSLEVRPHGRPAAINRHIPRHDVD
jgi:hypothetical protein